MLHTITRINDIVSEVKSVLQSIGYHVTEHSRVSDQDELLIEAEFAIEKAVVDTQFSDTLRFEVTCSAIILSSFQHYKEFNGRDFFVISNDIVAQVPRYQFIRGAHFALLDIKEKYALSFYDKVLDRQPNL